MHAWIILINCRKFLDPAWKILQNFKFNVLIKLVSLGTKSTNIAQRTEVEKTLINFIVTYA